MYLLFFAVAIPIVIWQEIERQKKVKLIQEDQKRRGVSL